MKEESIIFREIPRSPDPYVEMMEWVKHQLMLEYFQPVTKGKNKMITVFTQGTEVLLDSNLYGKISSIQIQDGGGVIYLVKWWDNEYKLHTAWLSADFFKVQGKEITVKIGFSQEDRGNDNETSV